MSSLEEDLSRAVAELQALERIVSELQNRAAALRALLSEYDGAISLLEELRNRKAGLNILIPIGGGNFLRAEIKDVEEVHVSLGAGVMIKKSLQDGYELIKKRRERISKSIKAHEETIVNYAQRMEELRRLVQALSARLAELRKARKEEK
ncbi:MAG: prefoldin subunit alpha [Thaumarchaeota archaeon]|nr:MAG: prefoldin subunit alpha [Nitrososphaerota archaeon]